jgi:hypothetical protein
LTAEN